MLERLVLPLPESKTLSGFCIAVKRWPALKSLTAAGVTQPKRLLKAITENCPDFSDLKHMGLVDDKFANTVITCLPKLKILSLRGSLIYREALYLILENLENLEVFNISHCLITASPMAPWPFYGQLDDRLLERGTRLKRFIVCAQRSCTKCSYAARHYRKMVRWFDYDEGFWKQDEVSGFTS